MREPRRLVALQNFLDHLTPKSPQRPTMHGNPKRLEFKAVQQELFDCDVKNVDKVSGAGSILLRLPTYYFLLLLASPARV